MVRNLCKNAKIAFNIPWLLLGEILKPLINHLKDYLFFTLYYIFKLKTKKMKIFFELSFESCLFHIFTYCTLYAHLIKITRLPAMKKRKQNIIQSLHSSLLRQTWPLNIYQQSVVAICLRKNCRALTPNEHEKFTFIILKLVEVVRLWQGLWLPIENFVLQLKQKRRRPGKKRSTSCSGY